MKTLITNTHAGKTRTNQHVTSLLTSSSNASAQERNTTTRGTTPMNHRKAMHAKGTSVNASVSVAVFPCSQEAVLVPLNSSGMTSLMSTRLIVINTAKMMPATAAARGVLMA